MANYPLLYARSPVATREYLANMAALKVGSDGRVVGHRDQCVARGVIDHDERSGQDGIPEETRLSKMLEKVNRPIVCGWHDCSALLGSLENLRKHVQKRHCRAELLEESESATSSKHSRCRYDICQNKRLYDSRELLEHFTDIHFNSLKLKCPVSKCKYKAQNVDRLAHHISMSHDVDIGNLPQSMIVPFSQKKQGPCPPLPDHAINAFTDMPMVMPNPSFNAARAARKMKELNEDAAAVLEGIESDDDAPKSAFARIKIPETIDGQWVRAEARIPCSPSFPNYDIPTQDDLPAVQAGDEPTIGYAIWKLRFKKAEESGKLPLAYRSNKRRR